MELMPSKFSYDSFEKIGLTSINLLFLSPVLGLNLLLHWLGSKIATSFVPLIIYFIKANRPNL